MFLRAVAALRTQLLHHPCRHVLVADGHVDAGIRVGAGRGHVAHADAGLRAGQHGAGGDVPR